MNAVTPLTAHYMAEFNTVKNRLPGYDVNWMQRIRETAMDRFVASGLPAPHHEDWKYTNIRPLAKQAFRVPGEFCVGLDEDDLGDALLAELKAHRLVFVNGQYTPQLSKPGKLPEGVKVRSLAQAMRETPNVLEPFLARYADPTANGFASLNAAFMGDGAVIELGDNHILEHPLHILFVSTSQGEPTVQHLRNLVVAGQNSQATIIEGYISLGEASYFNNVVTEVALADNANITHYKLQEESVKGFHVATLQVCQSHASRFSSHSISVGGALVRNDINSVLDAEGVECELNGLYIVNGTQHVDFHTRIDHRFPHGTSREFYKGVLGGRARAVFNGQVYVHPNAQKTDAAQSNKNLLLSRDAEIDTKPQLEIYADDVKCSHGATVGQLDEEMLFYLRSRGIEENVARGILTFGFAQDIVERMDIAPIRARIENILKTKLPHGEYVKALI
jgi:Fe-S cluster assembly protein SufD